MSDLKYGAPGPWDDEPDADDFEACGLKCAMRRHVDDGHWCGYVGVPDGHIFFGESEPQAAGRDFDVHGGLVYCGTGDWAGFAGRWWFGFHCGHLVDYAPGRDGRRSAAELYRDYDYVRAECECLSCQLQLSSAALRRLRGEPAAAGKE